MPHSHHSHSGEFCKHAVGRLEECVKSAIDKGFRVYGLTEHVPRYRPQDRYPEEEGETLEALSSRFDAFLIEAHRVKREYASQISLLVGLETEFITDLDLDRLSVLLERERESKRIQYIVGSVHHVNGIPIDFDRETYERCLTSFAPEASTPTSVPSFPDDATARSQGTTKPQLNAFLCAYFDAQYTLLTRFKPEVIGHIDLCRLYAPSLLFADYPGALAKLERNVRYAVSYGALFEANAAALRKGWEGSYPGEDVLRLILECGGRICLSDDSHGPQAVALNYARMSAYLSRVGVREIWYLCETSPSTAPNAGGRYVEPIRLRGDWMEDAFWAKLDSFSGSQS